MKTGHCLNTSAKCIRKTTPNHELLLFEQLKLYERRIV